MWWLLFMGLLATSCGVELSSKTSPSSTKSAAASSSIEPATASKAEKRSPQGVRVHGAHPQQHQQQQQQQQLQYSPAGGQGGQILLRAAGQQHAPAGSEVRVPQEYFHLLQELQAAQQQQAQHHAQQASATTQQASAQPAQHRYLSPSHGQAPSAQLQYTHGPQVQLVSAAPGSPYGLQHAQQSQLQHAQLQQVQLQQAQLAQAYQKQRPSGSPYLPHAQREAPAAVQSRHHHLSALADSSFEKELAQLVASNRAQEQAHQQQGQQKGHQDVQKQASAGNSQLYQPQQQYAYVHEQQPQQQQQPQYVQLPQQSYVTYQELAQLQQSQPAYVAPKVAQARKPSQPAQNHQYLAETTVLSSKANQYEQRQSAQPQYHVQSQGQNPYAVQYRTQQPVHQHSQSPAAGRYHQPSAAPKIPQHSPEDQEFLKNLFENQSQGYFQSVKQQPSHQQPQASRSSIYVSQSTPVKNVKASQQEQNSAGESGQSHLPPVRLPGPKDRPLTQEEFQALVNAGYSVTPIPVPVPVPVSGDKYNQQKYQQQHRDYVQPSEADYQNQARYQQQAPQAAPKSLKQRRLVRPSQYRLNEEQSSPGITYLVPLGSEANREYSGRTEQ